MIDQDYRLACKDSIGGVKSLYIFSYVNYSRKQIDVNNNELTLFPPSIIYKFDSLKTSDFSEAMQLDSKGEVFNQSINVTFSKIGNTYNFERLREGYMRAIVEDNNGLFWILGLYNGLEVTSYQKATGNQKQTLNGYTMTLTGKERIEAPYFNDLSIIEGVEGTGWTFLDASPFLNLNNEQLQFL